MKRELKFRAWDEKKNEFTDPIYMDGIFYMDEEFRNTCNSVEQFTGLKDKNGKDIYDEDIVSKGVSKWIVCWHNQQGMWWLDPIIDASLKNDEYILEILNNEQLGNGYYSREDLEIIGNIHENPELL
jgi:uncharacterized phage protein (TIGR01671 family)